MQLAADMTGRPLGKYELRERIGRGGMAEVYKAYHASLDRYVAVKVLHSFLSEDPEFKDRFEREARNIARLRHNHIVQVYDFDFEPGPDLYYMVMEYVEGPTLRNMLLQKEATGELLPTEEVIRISHALASALTYAHGQSMIHRDIKPGNIMLDADQRVVLTDFGIAKIVSGKQITASGTMIGTPAYMAPEQGLGQAGDHRSDIYSLGVVMFQLAAGAAPYEADTPIALVLKHVNDPLPPLTAFNPALPEGLQRIIYKSLAKDPEERFQNAGEIVELLDDLPAAARLNIPTSITEQTPIAVALPHKTVITEPPETIEDRAPVTETPFRYVWPAVGLLVLVAAIAAAIFLLPGFRSGNLAGPPAEEVAVEATDTKAPAPVEAVVEEETATPEPPPATAELEATALVATIDAIRAQRATQNALATQPGSGTDIAPVAEAEAGCNFDYALVSQSPEDNSPILENSTVSKQVVIRNTGDCDWEPGTRFAFLDGLQLDAPAEVILDEPVEIGDRLTLEIDLSLPAFSINDPTVQTTWQLSTADGQRIGRLFTFDFQVVPPTATPSPTLAPVFTQTPTS